MSEPIDNTAGPPNASEPQQESGKYFFIDGDRSNFNLGLREQIVLAKHAAKPKVTIAIRIRKGSSGYSEWMNELQVYLLPKFKHKHIVQFFGSEQHYASPHDEPFSLIGAYIKRSLDEQAEIPIADVGKRVLRGSAQPIKLREPESSASDTERAAGTTSDKNTDDRDARTSNIMTAPATVAETSTASTIYDDEPVSCGDGKQGKTRDACTQTDSEPTCVTNSMHMVRLEYWLMTKYCDSKTLREYLRENTLTWPQLLKVARGIQKGLYFLHENTEYQDFNNEEAIDGFIRSTNGALRRLAFREENAPSTIHMKPHLSLTIIHRNLNSMNIVLKRDLTPAIWNFGQAFVHCPFQPTNNRQLIASEIKRSALTSPYSPPEVLQERGHLSLAAMKSIDMYASGILLWELMARSVLPKLNPDASSDSDEQRVRSEPEPYLPPLYNEVGENPPVGLMDFAVRRRRVRPRIKLAWEMGEKTRRLVQTIRDLWDHDYDARLHPATVIDRLNRLSPMDCDQRCGLSIHQIEAERMKPFKKPRVWPRTDETSLGVPAPTRPIRPNKVFDDCTSLPVGVAPDWIWTDSDDDGAASVDGLYNEFHESLELMRTLQWQQAQKQRAKQRALRGPATSPVLCEDDSGEYTELTATESYEMQRRSRNQSRKVTIRKLPDNYEEIVLQAEVEPRAGPSSSFL